MQLDPRTAVADLLRGQLPSARWLLLGMVAFGLAVRLAAYLTAHSYWYDEAFVLVNVFQRSYPELLGALPNDVIHPPLGLWLLRFQFETFGPGERSMRLPSLLASVGAMLLLILVARRVLGDRGWLWVVAMGVFSGRAVLHGNETKPYAFDHLMTIAILLAAVTLIGNDQATSDRRRAMAGLFLLGILGPCISYPSAFVLAGASLAWLLSWRVAPDRVEAAAWVGFNAAVFFSGLAVWFFSARHLYYPGLREHWSPGFPGSHDSWPLLTWLADRLILIGHYSQRDFGIPLLFLSVVGLVLLARRSLALAALLILPAVCGFLAAFLRRYPMDDRCLMYLAATWWLLASIGLRATWDAASRHVRPALAVAMSLIVLLPAFERCKELFTPKSRTAFREAFAHVDRHWQPGDRLWVSHQAVYHCYRADHARLVSPEPTSSELESIVIGGRLWIVNTRRPWPSPDLPPDSFSKALRSVGCNEPRCWNVQGMDVRLYARSNVRAQTKTMAATER